MKTIRSISWNYADCARREIADKAVQVIDNMIRNKYFQFDCKRQQFYPTNCIHNPIPYQQFVKELTTSKHHWTRSSVLRIWINYTDLSRDLAFDITRDICIAEHITY